MYLRSILQNVNNMADKMIYNAHGRTVNLLANDGRDGVPFLDAHVFNKKMFSDFCPDNAISIVSRLNESWHRAIPVPAMVRMSTKQYPIGAGSSPFEEIDEVAGRMFENAVSTLLPTGRATQNRRKGRVSSHSRRDGIGVQGGGNWLAFPSSRNVCEATQPRPTQIDASHEPEARQNLCEGILTIQPMPTPVDHGHDDRADSPIGGDWRLRLAQHHMRMLAAKYPPKKKQQDVLPPKKKQKTRSTSSSTASTFRHTRKVTSPANSAASTGPHPSGSTTFELHQVLPPEAYFEPREPDEKPAWRCGIQHAMGHYYNAGNRKSCPGCFVNVKESAKTKHMDFYLPNSSHYFQHAADAVYKLSKPSNEVRRSKHLSHNSIAKEAYWAAINAGADVEEARRAGVDAVEAFLLSRAPKEPTPQPTPEPEPDLGPHPSGSATMEHGQDLPECAFAEKTERHEEYAWRCDLNHALGRYYLDGDKRSCPGCGSNRNSESKKAVMDFYMPFSVVVRQEAPGLSDWKPRRKNTMMRSSSKATKNEYLTHNQTCSRKYFEAVEAGLAHDEAVSHAIRELEEELEAKQAASLDVDMEDTEDMEDMEEPEEPYISMKRPFVEELDADDPKECMSPVEVEEEVSLESISSSDDEDTSGSDSQ